MTTYRQHTRALVTVHSHVSELGGTGARFIDLSEDCTSIQTQKTTMAAGKFQLQLVPRRNYLNLIFPNDLVNIYFDPGDGKRGFVRTMMGYIDRVERSEVVDDQGATTTNYTVIGTDFQKAVDKTGIYWNQYMRTILDERFARADDGTVQSRFTGGVAGSALRNAGLTNHGTPADFVENFLLVLMGFGTQWRLPENYSRFRAQLQTNRQQRVQRAIKRLPQEVITQLNTLGYRLEEVNARWDEIVKTARQALAAGESTTAQEQSIEAVRRRDAAITVLNNPALLAFRAAQEAADPSYPTGILDLISFDFIEELAIDGFNQNAAVWEGQGSLSQFLYGNSNDIVNELIFDLRPVSVDTGGVEGGLHPGGYSREPDELGFNTNGTPAMPKSVAGVHYVPAVVFREYPYSVVGGVHLDNILTLPAGTDSASKTAPQKVYFGPVFAANPGANGRHIYVYPQSISIRGNEFHPSQKAIKHIDAVVIRNTDVQTAQIGRSDNEVYNVFQLTPQFAGQSMNTNWRSELTNFMPILNQVSVARNGLRVWSGTTQFAIHDGTTGLSVGGSRDSDQTRRNCVRWSLLIDHWYQHNAEYLSGTINLRAMPEIRVGYRLDWEERNESYYVESVTNVWEYGKPLITQVGVTRGQRNDPFPAYVPPVFFNESDQIVKRSSGNRSATGRLGRFFKVRDTQATTRSTQKRGPFSLAENDVDQLGNLDQGGAVVVPSPEGDIAQTTGPRNPAIQQAEEERLRQRTEEYKTFQTIFDEDPEII